MIFTVPTYYDELTLVIKVKTYEPVKIRIKVEDASQPNTVYTDRYRTIDGDGIFYVRMPLSGQEVNVSVYNEDKGNNDSDDSFEVVSITKEQLQKKMDFVDLSNPYVKSFINFSTKFSYNSGSMPTGTYVSDDDNFVIKYLPTIMEGNKEETTPARIDIENGVIEVSKKQFVNFSVPNRMAILLHEFSHVFVNEDVNDEEEADLNALMIYLGLGYPRIEAFEVFAKTFENAPTEQNKKRYDLIVNFIDDFEKNNLYIYN
jgi:hypothetical protein